MNEGRRRFLQACGVSAVAASGYLYGHAEGNDLVVTRTDVHLPHWPSEAHGVKIGLISDFHADYEAALERTHRSAKMLMAEKPDIAFIGGDFVSTHFTANYLAPTIEALSVLTSAPGGAYAIMGNHDCWSQLHDLATFLLKASGVCVLNNVSVPFPNVPGAFIVGLDDPWCGMMDLPLALAGVPPDAPKLVAVHEPDFADSIGKGFDLQISGHSHGGQIRIPGLPVLHAPHYGTKYPEGLQKAQNHLVYTTRGIGMVGPQIRTFCPPEITVLTLRTKR